MDYEKGKRYRVVKEGAHLWGWQPVSSYQQGWRQDLHVGDVLTCMGESWTCGDGVPALKWGDKDGKWLANDCCFEPVKGDRMWGGQVPADGFLEPAA